jgi:hypothetical protein
LRARGLAIGCANQSRTWYYMPAAIVWFFFEALPDWATLKALTHMGPRSLALPSVAVCVFVACGGSAPGDLFSGDASEDGGSAIASDGGGTTSAADGAPLGSDGSAKLDSAVPSDGTLACGASSCKIPTETCCVARAGGSFTFSCVTGARCPSTGGGNQPTALKCANTADCSGGTVCCVTQANNQTVSACKSACGNNDAQLCDPAASPTGCPASAPCSSDKIGDWQLPSPFATCGGKGG